MDYPLKIKTKAKKFLHISILNTDSINTADFSICARFHSGSEKYYKHTPNTVSCPQGLYNPLWKEKIGKKYKPNIRSKNLPIRS